MLKEPISEARDFRFPDWQPHPLLLFHRFCAHGDDDQLFAQKQVSGLAINQTKMEDEILALTMRGRPVIERF